MSFSSVTDECTNGIEQHDATQMDEEIVLENEQKSKMESTENEPCDSRSEIVSCPDPSTCGKVDMNGRSPIDESSVSENDKKAIETGKHEIKDVSTTEIVKESQGEASTFSQEDMFASQPSSPSSTVLSHPQQDENSSRACEISVDEDIVEASRPLKRARLQEEKLLSEEHDEDIVETSPKRIRQSVEILSEYMHTQDILCTPSIEKRSQVDEELLNVTGETDESLHLHYSPSQEQDISATKESTTDKEHIISPKTIVLGSDDDDDDDDEYEIVRKKTVPSERQQQVVTESFQLPDNKSEDVVSKQSSISPVPPAQTSCVSETNSEEILSSNKQAEAHHKLACVADSIKVPQCVNLEKPGEVSKKSSEDVIEVSPIVKSQCNVKNEDVMPSHSSPYVETNSLPSYDSNSIEHHSPALKPEVPVTTTGTVSSSTSVAHGVTCGVNTINVPQYENLKKPLDVSQKSSQGTIEASPIVKSQCVVKNEVKDVMPPHSSPYVEPNSLPLYEGSSIEHHSPTLKPEVPPVTVTGTVSSTSEVGERVIEMKKNVLLQLEAVLSYRESSREVICYEITQCAVVEDAPHNSSPELSSGVLGDESKASSPGSVVSTGTFPLPMRVSIASSSSSSSVTSAAQMQLSRIGKPSQVPVINMEIVENAVRTLLPEPVPVPPGIFAGRRARAVASAAATVKHHSSTDLTVKTATESSLSDSVSEPRKETGKQSQAPVLSMGVTENAVHSVVREPVPSSHGIFAGRKARAVASLVATVKSDSNSNGALMSSLSVSVPEPTKETEQITEMRKQEKRTPTRRGRTRGSGRGSRSRGRGRGGNQAPASLGEPLTWGTEDTTRFKDLLQPGAPAFARWSDKRYYSAKLTEKQRDGRWLVSFDDGSSKILKEEFIIPVDTLSKGQLVYATLPDGTCADGIVSTFLLNEGEVQYGVELDDGTSVCVARSNIFLTEDQARLLQEGATVLLPAPSTPGRLADVDLNNLVTGKRTRTPLTPSASVTPCPPGPSGYAVTGKMSPSPSSSDKGSVSGSVVEETLGGVDPEGEGEAPLTVVSASSRGKGRATGKGKAKALFLAPSVLQDSSEFNETLGPIPPKGSKYFEGNIFLLTSVDFEPEKNSSTSDSEGEFELSAFRFVKERLRRQLEAGGGTVLVSLDDVPEDRISDTILIANRPCLTVKYIRCLARSIRIVSHQFVIMKSQGKTCTPNSFLLPLGWSLVTRKFVRAPDQSDMLRTRKGGSRQLLARKKLVLVHESPRFLAFWQRVLTDAGAKTTAVAPNDAGDVASDLKSADAIVSDSSCPPGIQERAREWRKPLISTIWITQCLINQKVLAYDALPHFRFDYTD